MTTLARRITPPRFLRRLSQMWQTYFAQGDITALVIALLLLLMPALSLSAAGWPLDLRTLIPVLLLSVFFGFLLARSHYNELVGLIISGIYGACFVMLIAAFNDQSGLGRGIPNVFTRLITWLIDASSGGINQDDLVFTLLVSSLFWFLGYNLAWHLFRVDRVWRAILPPALILLTNSVYYTGTNNLDGYLLFFVFLCLLLIIRSNLDAREWDWYLNGIRFSRKMRKTFFRVGAVLALVILTAAWIIPSSDIQERLDRFQEFLQNDPLMQFSELWNRLFTSAETQGPSTTDYYGSDSLTLGGAIRLSDSVVFLVSAPQGRRYYWRSRTFDNYDSGRWTSGADIRLTDPESPLEILHEQYYPGARVPVQQVFTMGLNASRLIYAAPQPLRVDLPTRTDLSYTAPENSPDQSMVISVIRPMRVMYQGETYTATSLMSNASADQLRQAGTNYPSWVTETYNSYIPSVTGRTLQLAQQIVNEAGAVTPYDRAKAIELWLRSNIYYSETIPLPPTGQDAVDWVLFDLRQGYCNYYASAMVVMLRTMGIPARMAAGFAQGEWNEGENAYVVREKDAHTWVEVYFPGYGWVEFEPTAAQAPNIRSNDTPPPVQQPTLAPTRTPTLTPTPTPTFTPEAPLDVPPTDVQSQQLPPTLTPTLTPSPTPTPVIIPTEPPPVRPQTRSPLSFLIPALTAALIAIFFVLLLVGLAIFLYWWWEWRGMRGLSPISRAYARLERYIPIIGIRSSPEQTPEERGKQVIQELPFVEPPVSAITRLYTSERYGRRAPDAALQNETADQAWSDTRTSILGRWLRRIFLPWRR
ncbi:MAG: transglutaminase domain-containing protein [Anaerolinea sp.]|nr:transglutaminase domain-containing protein [Anaerolinea sp.]